MAALEDLGFYCVDNLPVLLIEQFLDLCAKSEPPIEKIALAHRHARAGLPGGGAGGGRAAARARRRGRGAVPRLRQRGARQPLPRDAARAPAQAPAGTVEEGIAIERAPAGRPGAAGRPRDRHVPAQRPPAQGGGRPVRLGRGAADGGEPGLVRLPLRNPRRRAELLFDVRFLPNPYFEERLRPLTGRDPEVAEYVLKSARGAALIAAAARPARASCCRSTTPRARPTSRSESAARAGGTARWRSRTRSRASCARAVAR